MVKEEEWLKALHLHWLPPSCSCLSSFASKWPRCALSPTPCLSFSFNVLPLIILYPLARHSPPGSHHSSLSPNYADYSFPRGFLQALSPDSNLYFLQSALALQHHPPLTLILLPSPIHLQPQLSSFNPGWSRLSSSPISQRAQRHWGSSITPSQCKRPLCPSCISVMQGERPPNDSSSWVHS